MARVSTSAAKPPQLSLQRPDDAIALSVDRLIHDAKAKVISRSRWTHVPPALDVAPRARSMAGAGSVLEHGRDDFVAGTRRS